MSELLYNLQKSVQTMQTEVTKRQDSQAMEIRALQEAVRSLQSGLETLSNQLQRMSGASTHLQTFLQEWNSKFGALLNNS